ncbi:hypothetical protein EV138_6475 [Kribbella voronezhensis]|uniref:Uncharacterized protein n=1 Tax=Kribbella voronezhensis TaxID=2512212 RepID=A0A4R7SZM1_9ACTN|nr:hypothetical protein [Kribbella voronezhensis]TDU84007.1 hypothetical protein EV138_6475 [Kribbella voronezhensis]
MSNSDTPAVPVWTLSTAETSSIPAVADEGALTPERLAELRTALASFSSVPLVTLEAHPLPKRRSRATGLPLDALSPLAQELSRLVAANAKNVSAVAQVAESGEVLYRMLVPAKVAAQLGKGLVKPMASKAIANGVYGTMVDAATNVAVAKATLVPVEKAAAGTPAAGTAAGGIAAGAAFTVAAPLVLMAIAVAASAYADQQRQKAIEHIADLLEKLNDDKLEQERSELDGCRDAIDKATALLLDRGKVGASLGLDSAVHAISTATQKAARRVQKWEDALGAIVNNRVEVPDLEAAFRGISKEGGEFRTHVELAALAIALKRRVVVLQGVEAGQSDPDNPFENFVRSLRADHQRIDELETRVDNVLLRLSTLELRPPQGRIDKVMTRGQVDGLLGTSYRLRALGEGVAAAAPTAEVVIEIEKHSDGTLLVLPAHTP